MPNSCRSRCYGAVLFWFKVTRRYHRMRSMAKWIDFCSCMIFAYYRFSFHSSSEHTKACWFIAFREKTAIGTIDFDWRSAHRYPKKTIKTPAIIKNLKRPLRRCICLLTHFALWILTIFVRSAFLWFDFSFVYTGLQLNVNGLDERKVKVKFFGCFFYHSYLMKCLVCFLIYDVPEPVRKASLYWILYVFF